LRVEALQRVDAKPLRRRHGGIFQHSLERRSKNSGRQAGWRKYEGEGTRQPENFEGQVSNKLENRVASPKKLKNPNTSVTVVRTMEDD
jgi:hypothetical protein